jgi:hypothetical protein
LVRFSSLPRPVDLIDMTRIPMCANGSVKTERFKALMIGIAPELPCDS